MAKVAAGGRLVVKITFFYPEIWTRGVFIVGHEGVG